MRQSFDRARRGFRLAVCGLALVACGGDRPSFTDQVREIAAANSDEQPAMWDVSDEDTQVFLFGTVHTLRPETDWLTGRVQTRLQAAKAIYFEADAESQRALDQIEIAINQYGLYRPGNSLRAVLDDALEDGIAEATELVGVPLAGFDSYRPWLASLTLAQMSSEAQGFDGNAGVENVLGEFARDAGKQIRYFETGAEQMTLFASIPEPVQIEMLVQTAERMLEDPLMLDRMVAEWVEGDTEGLASFFEEDDIFGNGPVFETMLKGRNENWAGQIEDLLEAEEGVFFVAVGAGHLVGDDRLQEMLRAGGHEVVRVDKTNEVLR